MLVQFAFFGAYFVGSLLYFGISAAMGDPIAKIGYKNGVIIGLVLSAFGSALFWPAATIKSYPLFLVALFIVGIWLCHAVNRRQPLCDHSWPRTHRFQPFEPRSGLQFPRHHYWPPHRRLSYLPIFCSLRRTGADSVKVPYLMFCIAFLVLAAIFFMIRLPHVGEGTVEPGIGALKYPHVILGVLAIFMYVGGEVSIGSSIINFLGQANVAGMKAIDASKYVSLFWGGMLIGRFMGAIELSEMQKAKKQVFLIVVPLLAYLFLWTAISAPLDAMHGGSSFSDVLSLWQNNFIQNWSMFRVYLPLVALCWLMFQFGRALAGRTLFIFCLTIVALLIAAILVGGIPAMWCVVGVGLFTSIGWPNIFSLALDGMGVLKSQVSSLLVMAILGGALLPPLMGVIADATHDLRPALLCSPYRLRLCRLLWRHRPQNWPKKLNRIGIKG